MPSSNRRFHAGSSARRSPNSGKRKPGKTGRPQVAGGGKTSLLPRGLDIDVSASLPAVFLHSPVRQPAVFRKRIRQVDPSARNGDLVAVYADFKVADGNPGVAHSGHSTEEATGAADTIPRETRLLGYGIYNARAEISLRMISFEETVPGAAHWARTLQQAVALRKEFLNLDAVTNAYRVIHADSDGCPGLMVDRFGDVLSAEVFSLGMYQRSQAILESLLRETGASHYLIRTAPHVMSQEGFDGPDIASADAPDSVVVQEFGTRFRVRFDREGHKTGFFCDQRDNRRRLAEWCAGKSVLDLCCYTGGFAVQAKKLGDANEVIGVDLDQAPLEVARENAKLNQCSIRFVNADIFPYMRDSIRAGKQFDVVVLDPPKLIRSRQELEEGTRAHFDMNRLAMRLVKPGGLFLTCTCAGLLGNADFVDLIGKAARRSDREGPADLLNEALQRPVEAKILARTGAGADHPVGLNCLETEYLHAVWMQVGAK